MNETIKKGSSKELAKKGECTMIEEIMQSAQVQAIQNAILKTSLVKEPLLRKIITGEKLTEREVGFLEGIQEVEKKLVQYKEEAMKENQETD